LAAEPAYLFYNPPTFTILRDWIITGGVVLFFMMAVISFRSLRNDWTPEREDQATNRGFGFLALLAVAPVLIVIAGVVLFPSFSWFATIPSWAAVIIVLLVLIYLKK